MTSQASNAAVSGMNAFNTALAGASKNIANSETVGYKACQSHFVSQVTGAGLSTNSFASGGVSTVVEQLNDAQGLLVGSASSTDIGILGNGFMVVSATA
ncbi:MAG: flagellar basal body protein [Janthinobacterium lividum]